MSRKSYENEIVPLLKRGLKYSEIVDKVGCTKSSISFYANKHGLRRLVWPIFDWNKIQSFYDKGHSLKECMVEFGFSSGSWSKAKERGEITPRTNLKPIETYLVKGRRQTGRTTLKNRLIKEGFLKDRCCLCGLTNWQGRFISLQLDHINGDRYDNRIFNLRLLCPNCHSQTETFASKNSKRY